MRAENRKYLTICAALAGCVLTVQYLLPLLLPFVLGAALALAAEPLVICLCRLRLPRGAAAGIGVSMAFALLALLILVLAALALREVRALAGILPDLEQSVSDGLDALSAWLLACAEHAPESIRDPLRQDITALFSGGSELLGQASAFVLRLASGVLSRVPDGALLLGTGILSSYMISAKLPRIRQYFADRLPESRLQSAENAMLRMKSVVGGWLRAQARLSGVTLIVLTAGLSLLRIPYAPLFAGITALVDVLPVLGTGTILLPWSLTAFLQGERLRAFGLLGVYAAVALIRSALEPRLVGRQIGLDPLLTLAAIYIGYRLWGFGGMLFAPLLTVAAVQLLPQLHPQREENA